MFKRIYPISKIQREKNSPKSKNSVYLSNDTIFLSTLKKVPQIWN